MANSVERILSPLHPTADGHFPGNPIIPGAVLLDEVVSALYGDAPAPYEIRSAKFFRLVRPGDRILIRWNGEAGGELKFECRLADEQLVLSGSVRSLP